MGPESLVVAWLPPHVEPCAGPSCSGPAAAWVPEGLQKGLARRPQPAAPPAQALLWLLGLAALWTWTMGIALPKAPASSSRIPYHLLQELIAKYPLSPTGVHLHTPGPLSQHGSSASSAHCLAGSIMGILAHSRVSHSRG